MRRSLRSFFPVPAAVAGFLALTSLAPTSLAQAAGIADYQLTRTFTLPTPSISFSNVLFDALPDGRLLALNGTTLLRETTAKSGTFASVGTVGNFSTTFGASFFTVSPDGLHAAVGSNNGSVTIFNTATPSTGEVYAVGDNDAAWFDSRLAVSNSAGVQVIDTVTKLVKTVVNNVGGASAGVAFDAAGNLYTGNGFDGSPLSKTGSIKAFAFNDWDVIASSGHTPLDFQATGSAIADLLSAGSLKFDATGNLFVGGGDFYGTSGDYGYAGLVDAAAVQAAFVAGGATPPVSSASSASVLRKFISPTDTVIGQQPPVWAYNTATGEAYLRYAFGSDTVSVYSVPEPTALGGLLLVGMAGLRRRRRQLAAAAAVASVSTAASVSSAAYVYDANDFAVEVVSATALPGTSLYNDANAVLGRPTLKFNSGNVATPDIRRAKLVEGIFNTGPAGEKLITTFNAGQSLTLRMGRPVTDDASHPFGIDLNVFGNAFFTPNNTGGNTGDDTNLNTTTLGSIFAENVRISVSPDNVNWYAYTNGPTGDGYFPTNSYRWDRTTADWTNEESDPTKPINPAYRNTLTGLTAADALDLYNGAAGGAGFDLAESGFAQISYVRIDGLTGYSGGEIDAVAAVTPEPAMLGVLAVVGAAGLRRRTR